MRTKKRAHTRALCLPVLAYAHLCGKPKNMNMTDVRWKICKESGGLHCIALIPPYLCVVTAAIEEESAKDDSSATRPLAESLVGSAAALLLAGGRPGCCTRPREPLSQGASSGGAEAGLAGL